jgi:hypothetical protein
MQQHMMYLAEPVTGAGIDPHLALGLLIAVMVVYVVVRYLAVILTVLALILVAILLVGASQIETLIAQALGTR